jgi:hypothetical protein
MPARPEEKRPYAQIIHALGYDVPFSVRGIDMQLLGLRFMYRFGLRMLIIDEIHHLLNTTS